MDYKVVVSEEALKATDEIIQFYIFKVREPKVAASFLEELKSSYESLIKFNKYQYRYKSFRAYPLRKHPFLVYFEVLEESKIVKIATIFPTLENPKKLKLI